MDDIEKLKHMIDECNNIGNNIKDRLKSDFDFYMIKLLVKQAPPYKAELEPHTGNKLPNTIPKKIQNIKIIIDNC